MNEQSSLSFDRYSDVPPPTATVAAHKDEYPFIETLRAFASILVVLNHTRNWFFEITTLGAASKLMLPFYFITALARESVIVFFVVSGFLVGGRALMDMEAGRFSTPRYFAARFARIYIAYLPALAVTLAIFYLLHLADPATVDTMGAELNIQYVAALGGAGAVACHLANMQGLFCSFSLSNPALWSLGYEWMLYLAAPLVFGIGALVRPVRLRAAMMLCLAAGTLALVVNPAEAVILCSIWFLSAVSYRRSVLQGTSRTIGYAALAICALFIVVARLKIISLYITNPAIGIALLVALSSRSVLVIRVWPGLSKFLASFSFSLYVTHLPVAFAALFLMRHLGLALRPEPMALAPFAAFASLVGACVAFAFVFSRLTEVHTVAFRRWLLSVKPAPRRVGEPI